jgi:hypothetical protein
LGGDEAGYGGHEVHSYERFRTRNVEERLASGYKQ